MTRSICLNADIGELPGEAGRALDHAILDVVSRCSIACGGHAGDAESMAETLRMAKARGVLAGAHPSYADREGFGRSRNNVSLPQLALSLKEQVASLLAIAAATDTQVRHIKPHGTLYNDAARDGELATLTAALCVDAGINTLLGPPASELERAAQAAGLTYVTEGFADRAYEPDLSLTPRALPGAVLEDPAAQSAQALSMALDQQVRVRTGTFIPIRVQTICLHGDTPGAARSAALLRAALEQQGITIHP
ncbi:LamB/YcsF family protein [Hyphomonas neptunium ATCC 15444]|uniref:LamB/YcsF family protein n=2 Tax=Hyphomonas TaxID=85 RepID=Q0C0C1_HYPNA|nr:MULTISPECIES: 5-oxoprolinase subunit PxpA [Hyphomonas]ABI75620.1 LamB/YcsF family protein [Hyphomonas neptunium ATCC 15444]KCZ90597.1 LamB/YcsF family protein [Hyphomonas hirschiana VP5]